jgi:hypothetical protein
LRKFILAGVSVATALFVLAPSAFAQSFGGCQLQGTANISPGLTNTAQPFTYSFSGNLSSCGSSQGAVPATGTVSAGKVITVAGLQYQEPIASGTGSCGSSTTSGTSIAFWPDGTNTVVSYSTTGALAAVQLSGKVIPSVTLNQVGGPGTTTITTTRYAGNSAGGLLVFQPSDPTACGTTGVTTAAISGGVSFTS